MGIIFLGTPHQGSGVANIGEIAAAIAGAVLPGAQIFNRGLIGDLKRNSDTLFETSNRFANICSGMKIYSFHEIMTTGPRVVWRPLKQL